MSQRPVFEASWRRVDDQTGMTSFWAIAVRMGQKIEPEPGDQAMVCARDGRCTPAVLGDYLHTDYTLRLRIFRPPEGHAGPDTAAPAYNWADQWADFASNELRPVEASAPPRIEYQMRYVATPGVGPGHYEITIRPIVSAPAPQPPPPEPQPPQRRVSMTQIEAERRNREHIDRLINEYFTHVRRR